MVNQVLTLQRKSLLKERDLNLRWFKTFVLTAFFICLALRATHLAMGVDPLQVVALRFSTKGLRCSRPSALRADGATSEQ